MIDSVASPTVTERLERLEAEGAILRTLYAYGHAIDYGDEEAWVDCFTEDGVFDVRTPRPERFNARLAGRDELRRFVANHSRAPERWHKHLVIEPVVHVDRETATCESYFGVLVDHEGMPSSAPSAGTSIGSSGAPTGAGASASGSPRSSRCETTSRRSSGRATRAPQLLPQRLPASLSDGAESQHRDRRVIASPAAWPWSIRACWGPSRSGRMRIRWLPAVVSAVVLVAVGASPAVAAPRAPAVDVKRGVVDVSTDLAYQGAAAAGTGIVLSSSGLVLTNNHVIRGATTVHVTDVSTGRTYPATVVGYSVSSDVGACSGCAVPPA